MTLCLRLCSLRVSGVRTAVRQNQNLRLAPPRGVERPRGTVGPELPGSCSEGVPGTQASPPSPRGVGSRVCAEPESECICSGCPAVPLTPLAQCVATGDGWQGSHAVGSTENTGWEGWPGTDSRSSQAPHPPVRTGFRISDTSRRSRRFRSGGGFEGRVLRRLAPAGAEPVLVPSSGKRG